MSRTDRKHGLMGVTFLWQETTYKGINKLNIIFLNIIISILKKIKHGREQSVGGHAGQGNPYCPGGET